MKTTFATFFPNNLIATIMVMVIAVTGCTIFPDTVDDDSASYDASTPSQYDNKSGGFLFFTEEEKGVELEEDDGIKKHTDQYGNKVWEIDKQHLTYFALLNQWRKSKRKTDSIWSSLF